MPACKAYSRVAHRMVAFQETWWNFVLVPSSGLPERRVTIDKYSVWHECLSRSLPEVHEGRPINPLSPSRMST